MTQIHTLTLAADHITPVSAYTALRSHAPDQSSFLFESVHPGERWGRYSIIGSRTMSEAIYPPGGALAMFAKDMATLSPPDPRDPASPFADTEDLAANLACAMFGYIAYDAIHEPHGIDLWPGSDTMLRIMRDPTLVVFDNLRQTVTIAGTSRGAVNRCEWEMSHGPELWSLPAPDRKGAPEHVDVSVDDEAYMDLVRRAKEYILAGDVFQVVLARTFTSPQRQADPFDVYRALRVLSPSPYLFYIDFAETPMAPRLVVAGASPETLVRLQKGKMTVRPIAGTRPRGATPEEDRALAAELLADPKERAEHVMLIDLARNDVGRVCEPGSVELAVNMEVERSSHVMHIVSEVTGRTRAGVTSSDVVEAAFPAGTLSGAPKVRAMQIIREMEKDARGVYGGAVGYVLPDGSLDFAIAIRSVVMRNAQFSVTAGAGIVEGSVPELEAEETRNKAQAALAAIRAAQDAVGDREKRAEARRVREAKQAERERAAREQAAANEPPQEGGAEPQP